MSDKIYLGKIRTNNLFNVITLYDGHGSGIESFDSPFKYGNSTCEYYEPDEFNIMTEKIQDFTS